MLAGFTDGEGCFLVVISGSPPPPLCFAKGGKSKRLKSGWDVRLRFQITVHRKDGALLEMIRAYFGGVGSILK
jgi:LAGLIDADG endonuclease